MNKTLLRLLSMFLTLTMLLSSFPGYAQDGNDVDISVALNADNRIVAHTTSMDGKEIEYTICTSLGETIPESTPEPEAETEHTVETTGTMFSIIRSVLKKSGDAYTAQITLSGTGYDKVYMGSAADAVNDSANWISYSGTYDYTNDEGTEKTGYVFSIPVSAVNTSLALATHAIKSGEWKDRTVTFIVATGDPAPEATPSPSPTPAPTPHIESTPGKVNSSTSLADGVYKPDKFSWSGGSGRTSISCSKVTVRGGKAYATISFSSSSYSYVKASGSKYYGSNSGERSTFEIPVNLNANNHIVGMTTAMSIDHEISYTIYIYIAGAKDAAAAVSEEEKQAEIIGLDYTSADKLENAKLFKVCRYEGGYTVIDVANVGKYLIVPEGKELPVGIEEEAIVVQQPVLSIYAASENALHMIDGLALAETPLKSFGLEDYAFTNIDPETIVYAGNYDAPIYAALLKSACDLAIMPEVFAQPDENETPLPEEVTAVLNDVQDRLGMLGIPMFVDRSADEESDAARIEWIKVYGILLGCEEAADAYYAAAIAELEA